MVAYSTFFFHIPQLPEMAPPIPSSSRGSTQFKSFLSLDIADSVLSRSSSIRSSTADIDNYSVFSDTTISSFFPPHDGLRKPRTKLVARPVPSRSSSTSSQSSMKRALPRPKPAPRETLPEVPHARPSLPRIQTSPAATRTRPRSRTGPSSVPKHAPKPAPREHLAPSPVPYSAITSRQRPASMMTGTSTASTNYRRVKRTDALARLEGRIDTQHPPRSYSPPPYSPYAAVHRTKSAAPVLATKSFMPFSEEDSDSDDYELDFDDAEHDVRVELVPVPSSPDIEAVRPREKKGRRARAGTIDSWFVGPPPASAPAAPPKNFMDFEDVDPYEDRYAKRGYL